MGESREERRPQPQVMSENPMMAADCAESASKQPEVMSDEVCAQTYFEYTSSTIHTLTSHAPGPRNLLESSLTSTTPPRHAHAPRARRLSATHHGQITCHHPYGGSG